ncbi:MAG: hypothetical protein V2I43_19120, partial [Parvularcula sp.]|nr:hypothetical protein [Parvularcula sp.]
MSIAGEDLHALGRSVAHRGTHFYKRRLLKALRQGEASLTHTWQNLHAPSFRAVQARIGRKRASGGTGKPAKP